MELGVDTLRLAPLRPQGAPASPRSRKPHRATRPQLLNRDQLDGRTNAAKAFDAIAEGIAQDLGGHDQLSTIQRHLVEAFAGAAVHVHDLNARLLLGQEVDILAHSQAISTMVRVASRIGVKRVARDITPPLHEYLPPVETGDDDDE
jgi:hypothetical protein